MQQSVRVEHITKTFKLSKKQQKIQHTDEKVKVAVNDLSFEATPGQIYGLLGPNGAGKTTTLRCISTLIKPDAGNINIGGHDVSSQPEIVRRNIAFLTSEMRLEDFFTPNYLFEYFANLHDIDKTTMLERKEFLFNKFGIDRFAEVKVGELSSGMRQKTQLAIALVHDPDIIIFDEPTNGLDVITAKTVTDYLLELCELGKTIIVSTHIFSLVEKICDRVGIILDGRLKVDDDLDAITKDKDLETFFFDLVEEDDMSHE